MTSSRGPRDIAVPLLAYAVALAVFLLVPPFLKAQVGGAPGFSAQEAADLLTPLVAMPLAWLVLERAGAGRWAIACFVVLAAAWTEGQGMHLAANAIGDAFPDKDSLHAFYATDPGALDLWIDETLSHWVWHAAWVAISLLFLAVATRPSMRIPDAPSSLTAALRSPAGLAGFVHGATFFVVSVEGVTTLLGIPASIVLLVWSALLGARGRAREPIVAFFLVGSTVTLLGYLGWAAMNHWTLPEFSKVFNLFG